jgi:hypothetical protein
VGAGSGSLALLVDGTTVASGSNLDLGSQGLTWFAVGERYAPLDSETAGHLYIDDVAATDPTAPATIPAAGATPGAARILPLARQLSPRASAQRRRLLGHRGALQRHHPQPPGRIVLSPAARGHGAHNAISATHSSPLRSLAQIYRVRPLLGHAHNATALGDFVATFP